jgi:hypothetical protein
MSYTRWLASYNGQEDKTYGLPILPFNDKLVLQHDQVAFSRLILHQPFHAGAQSVKEVSSPGLYLLSRKEPDPSEPRNDSACFKFIGEFDQLLDARDEIAMFL